MRVTRFAAIAALALCLQSPLAQADEILGSGSTFVAPVIAKWSTDFGAKGGDTVSYQRTGSAAGLAALKSGIMDFAASDAPLKPAELQRAGLLQFPLVVGGVVPVVNLDGVAPGALHLTGAVLADIFLGMLTRWNDPRIAALNPGLRLPAAAIIVSHRAEGSGTTFNWTSYLSKASAGWRDRVGEGLSVAWPVGVGGRGNDGVAAFVKQTKNAIGYVDFASVQHSRLSYALVENKAGHYSVPGLATFEAAAAAADWTGTQDFRVVLTDSAAEDAWPLAATSFVLMDATPRLPARTRAALDFFRWGLTRGQHQAAELGYVALSPALVSRVDAYWAARFTDRQHAQAQDTTDRRAP
jgi:phosphate transport system substrate-binding protein